MKVRYKPEIHEMIQEAINTANKHDRKIEKIVLTKDEWDELTRYVAPVVGGTWRRFEDEGRYWLAERRGTFMGVAVESEP